MHFVIETDHLSRRFGKKEAVTDLTLKVPEGSIFAFIGPNGAGKTTTIKMLMNILEPTGGEATVLGVNSRRLGPKELAQIGYVSENQQLPDWMTVRELLAYCKPMYATWDDAFCRKLQDQFRIQLDERIRDLSRGMKIKVALLSALAYRPRLLVLDEPFSGLDPLVRDELSRAVLEMAQQAKWSVFISSHDVDEVERLADWVAFLNEGRLILAEPISVLRERYHASLRETFLILARSVLPQSG